MPTPDNDMTELELRQWHSEALRTGTICRVTSPDGLTLRYLEALAEAHSERYGHPTTREDHSDEDGGS